MVEFCKACGVSLPKGDLTIKEGEIFTSYDYICPECGNLANPPLQSTSEINVEPTEEKDIIIRNGEIILE